jgi:hypothetical protein
MNELKSSVALGALVLLSPRCTIFDISCCLAMDQERLQGSFLHMGMKPWIKFHVLLRKSALEYYKLLKEGLRTHAPSHETVCPRVNAIKNGWEQTRPLAVEPQHQWQVNTTWKKWNLSLNVRAVFHGQQFLHKLEYLQVFNVFSPTAWRNEKCVHTGFHMHSTMTEELCTFFLPPPTCSTEETKALYHSVITF